MENEQELPEVKTEDSNVQDTGIAEKFTKQEFTRTKEKEPIEKLADEIESKPESTTEPAQPELPNTDSGEESKVPPKKETFDIEKWDGKVDLLPEKLRKIVVDNQAAYTAKAQEAAKLKQEIELLTRKPTIEQPLFTPDEYEEAQLNPAKFAELVNRVASKVVEQKSAELLPVLTKVQHEQAVAQNEKLINEFAETHEDFWELHDASPELFMALVDKTRDLNKTYETLKKFKSHESEKAKLEAQSRIKEKKNASTFTRSPNTTENVMFIEGTQDDVLRKQIEFVMQGKNIRVKLKK